ncbi:MAG TPA: DUF748 domain-containing protein [Candidatus Binataceae bacterium]|nr:DUF748 domain-containing protein [Candidatus Binataceae bacterium]
MAETSNAKFATGSGRWIRRVLWIVLALLVLYSIAGFFVVPRVFRSVLTGQVAKAIHRPVTVGKVGFNPFRLRLDLDQLHIADREPQTPFVDLGHLRVKVSWTSLFRLAPVIGEVALERPSIHLVRTGPQQFNFSDILEKPAAAPTPATPAAPSKPFRFAVSNIQIADGEILLDDKVVGQQHSIQKLQLGVPFVANLPADVDIFVQPLLRMIVDGSPVNIEGRTKPFGTSLESIAEIKLNQIDLPRYVGYVPVPLPVKVPQGKLSAVVDVHFVNGDAGPIISLAGTVAVQELDLRDPADAPLLGLKALVVNLNDVEPLHNVIHLGAIGIDGLNAHLVLNQDGTTNLTPLMGAKPAATPVAESSAAAQPSPTATPRSPPRSRPRRRPRKSHKPISSLIRSISETVQSRSPTTRARQRPRPWRFRTFTLARRTCSSAVRRPRHTSWTRNFQAAAPSRSRAMSISPARRQTPTSPWTRLTCRRCKDSRRCSRQSSRAGSSARTPLSRPTSAASSMFTSSRRMSRSMTSICATRRDVRAR